MVLAVIPARFASTRFPGKPLVDILGKSMIRRVYEQTAKASRVDQVVVATDDERIHAHVTGFGGLALMTSASHASGTDRCAEVAQQFPDAKLIINVQGDEPFIQPEQIDLLAGVFDNRETASIATLVLPIRDTGMLFNPNVVKAVITRHMEALYFSRQAIPYCRGLETEQWLSGANYYKHIGMYGFRRETLLELAQLAPGALERAESLEQLRWLEQGYRIAVAVTDQETIGIDTPDDLARIQDSSNS